LFSGGEILFDAPWILEVCLFVVGALFGSFANVVIYRLPKGESVVWPGSRCSACGRSIRWFHNIPIFAWFFLRGRCADCGAKYSFRYPSVELLMAGLFSVAGYVLGPSYRLIEALPFIFGLVTVSVIDIDHMILPDKFTLSGIVIGLAGGALSPDRSFVDALIGALLGFGFLWSIAYLYFALRGREGMGGGDIKLLAWIGAVLGWKSIPLVILLSSLLGSLVGVTSAFRTKEGMHKPIPFGPYLALAAILYLLLAGDRWSEWYLALHGF
jgi:leader peptidase (prepilin peptidase)/N-methyltransferase